MKLAFVNRAKQKLNHLEACFNIGFCANACISLIGRAFFTPCGLRSAMSRLVKGHSLKGMVDYVFMSRRQASMQTHGSCRKSIHQTENIVWETKDTRSFLWCQV